MIAKIVLWLVFWSAFAFALLGSDQGLDRVIAACLAAIGITLLALAEIDEHLTTRRGWYKR